MSKKGDTFGVQFTDELPETFAEYEARLWHDEPLLSLAFALHTTLRNALVTLFAMMVVSLLYDVTRRYPRIDNPNISYTSSVPNASRRRHDEPTTISKLLVRGAKGVFHIVPYLLVQYTVTRSTTIAARWLSNMLANDTDRRQCKLREALGYSCMMTIWWLTFLNTCAVTALLSMCRKRFTRRSPATPMSTRCALLHRVVLRAVDVFLATPTAVVILQRRSSPRTRLKILLVQAVMSMAVFWVVDGIVTLVAIRAARARN